MCDEQTEQETLAYLKERGITRRDFNTLGAGATLSLLLPSSARAVSVTERDVLIDTPDGVADCYFITPGEGKHAAVVFWPDILGLRPAFRQMGKRLAEAGYSVLVVNPYYRTDKAPLVPLGASFADPEIRSLLMPKARSLSADTCVTDGNAFIDWLDQQPSVDTSRKVGTAGYCMTGSYTFRLAAARPDRVAAGASFHGGRLVSDEADSPHRLISKTKAEFLVAIAENDDERAPETKNVLRSAFAKANVTAEVEVYAGAMHGWCALDSRAYNAELADQAWLRMLALFAKQL